MCLFSPGNSYGVRLHFFLQKPLEYLGDMGDMIVLEIMIQFKSEQVAEQPKPTTHKQIR